MTPIRLSALDWICFALLIIGALNWGIVGLVEINVIESIMGAIFQDAPAELVTRTLYVLVGLAGLYVFYPLYRVSNLEQRRGETAAAEQS